MPTLFSYGTLRDANVQRKVFGHELSCEPDSLPGFQPAVAGPHANVVFTGDPSHSVRGTALNVTDAELAVADEYERPFQFRRIQVTLSSGRSAWVYCFAPDDGVSA